MLNKIFSFDDDNDKGDNKELSPEEIKELVNSKQMAGQSFLRKAVAVETGIPSPIQGPVLDEQPLFNFIKDNHDATIPKTWGVFLDENHMVLGIEPLAFGDSATPEAFNTSTKIIFHYFSVFFSSRFVLIHYRVNPLNDPTPTDDDKKLIDTLLMQSKVMEADLSNYVIVAGDHYWSTRQQNGTACHCGSQHYIPEE